MTVYTVADEVAQIAWELIQDHHPHLEPVRIDYVFRDEAAASRNKIVLGKARKITGLNAFLGRPSAESNATEDFFVLEIAADTWAGMDESQRIALVDHELCHFVLDEKGKLALNAHDVEEFTDVILRHGLWKRDVAEFVEAGKGVNRLPLANLEGWTITRGRAAAEEPADEADPDHEGDEGDEGDEETPSLRVVDDEDEPENQAASSG